MTTEKKVLFEELNDAAKASLRRKSIRDLQDEQNRAKKVVREIMDACPEADGIHDFEAGAEKLKADATELKTRYANASAWFTECQALHVEKSRSEGMRAIANAPTLTEEDARDAGYASYPGENIFARMERLHGATELAEDAFGEMIVSGEQKSIEVSTATFHDINNAVMKRSGGSADPPTGIVTSKPVNVDMPYEAVDKRRALVDILPTIVGNGDTFKFRKEIDAGVANSVAPAAEGDASALQSFGAEEDSVVIETLRAYGTITEEQAKDVQVARPYASMLLSRGMKDTVETQLVGGNGTSPNLRGLRNISGRLTDDKSSATPAPDLRATKLLDYILDMMAIYEAERGTGSGTSATHCIMRPATHRLFQKQKTTDDWYLYGNPANPQFMTLWGVPVIYSDFAAANEIFYINADPRYILFVTRQGVSIQSGWNGTDFANNQRSLRITQRCALACPRPTTIQQLTNVHTTS